MEDKAKDATTVIDGAEKPAEEVVTPEQKKKAREAEAQKAKDEEAKQPAAGQSSCSGAKP